MSDHDTEPAYEQPQLERPAGVEPTLPLKGEGGVEGEVEFKPSPHDPYHAWRSRGFGPYLLGNSACVMGRQMTSVAVGWEIYQRTHSPTLLGLVGLATALPLFAFTIPAGQLADSFQRKQIILVTQVIAILVSLGLAALSLWHAQLPAWPLLEAGRHGLEWIVSVFDKNGTHPVDLGIVAMLAILTLGGVARTFEWAAKSAFVPLLVPKEALSNAITWNSSTFQTAGALGPAVGGFLIAKRGFPIVYGLDALCTLAFLFSMLPVRVRQEAAAKVVRGSRIRELLLGLRFVFETKLVLATNTLDLFAVLLGGATALLPLFADRLHVGPVGLGWMRAADSLGAIGMGLVIAHMPPMKQAGKAMLWAVAAFGFSIIAFGLSTVFWFSLVALFFTGVFDSVSVVVRHTLVQYLTPDSLRGRVSAVNNIFIGTSNELGAFESGMTAGLFGPVASVALGGVGTVLAVLAVATIWPELRRFRSFDSAKV